MKQITLIVAAIFGYTLLFAQSTTKDEAAIRNIIKQQQTEWNKHDWDAFSQHFTDDATLINSVGEIWKGKADIINHFNLIGDCCLSPTSLIFDCKTIKFLSPDIAVAYMEETLFADKDYEVPFRKYKKGDKDYKLGILIFEKKNNEWKIVSTQITMINEWVRSQKAAQ